MKNLGAALALPTLLTTLLATLVAAPAQAQSRAEDNPWLQQRVLNMAHSGGEREAPTNTMYAFKRAVALGADMIELDVQSTRDKQLVVLHDARVDETTDGRGKVEAMTLRQVRRLDAAHWFVPRRGTTHDAAARKYRFRGVRTGDRPAPDGYKRTDFAVPTLTQVLRRFPGVPDQHRDQGHGRLRHRLLPAHRPAPRGAARRRRSRRRHRDVLQRRRPRRLPPALAADRARARAAGDHGLLPLRHPPDRGHGGPPGAGRELRHPGPHPRVRRPGPPRRLRRARVVQRHGARTTRPPTTP